MPHKKKHDEKKKWEFWSKKQSFTLVEGVMLECGCLPTHYSEESTAKTRLAEEALVGFDNSFELIYSSLCADKEYGGEWYDLSKEEAASKRISRELFDYHWKKSKLPRKNKFRGKSGSSFDQELNPRTRENMLKMIIAMAMIGYKYDPKKVRNQAVKEIEEDMEKLGIPLGDDTIRDYLNEAKELLPLEE